MIEGYGARISLTALGPLSIIFMEAELSSHRAEDFKRFEDAVIDIPEIAECWAVGGGIDYVMKFTCKDIDSYQRLVDRLLEDEIGLRRYFTYIVTKAVKQAPMPPIDLFNASE